MEDRAYFEPRAQKYSKIRSAKIPSNRSKKFNQSERFKKKSVKFKFCVFLWVVGGWVGGEK